MALYDDGMTAFQLGYLDGAYDQAHWMGEEKSFDWGGNAWGLYADYRSGYWDGWNNTQPLPEEYINSSRSWHEWLREDYDTPDALSRMFLDFEATIAELRRQLREQQTRPPRYTHRNGESEEPTIAGWYWVYGGYDDVELTMAWYSTMYQWETTSGIPESWRDTLPTNIYGPIPQPITKETSL